MALRTADDDQDTKHNQSEADYRRKFDDIKKAEEDGSFNDIANNYDKTADDTAENRNIDKVKNGEESPDKSWRNNVSGASNYGGNKSSKDRILTPNNMRAVLKKRGPLGLIAVILGGGTAMLFFTVPALLPLHIKEMLVNKYDSQNTSMTIRTNKLIAKKIGGEATSGSCSIVKVACRFSRPSNKLLRGLEKSGIQALDSKGDVISPKKVGFNTRPLQYRWVDSGGVTKTATAPEFLKALNSDPNLRANFHRAYNPRFIGFADSVAQKVKARFGIDKTNKTSGAKDAKALKEDLDKDSKGISNGAKEVAGESIEESGKLLKGILSSTMNKALAKLAKTGKGSGATLVAGAVCLLTDMPSLIASAARSYQMVQLVRYSYTFLVIADAIKAGDATPSQVSAIGGLLTAVVNNKSAMDSFGMKYTLFGDTSPTSNDFKKFVPGGSVTSTLGGWINVTQSDIKQSSCSVATDPGAGAALNFILVANSGETAGAAAVIAGLNFLVGWGMSELISNAAPMVVDWIVGNIPADTLKGVMGFFFGDLTQDLAGESVGDSVVSGVSNMMAETSNGGGNMPLSVDQAIAYDGLTRDVQLAYAEEDRATLNPLDATNTNTMMGSFVNQLLPYYGSLSSLSGTLTTVASLATSSIASLLNKSVNAAEDPSLQYTLCDDPTIKDRGIAAGPFCNIQYGVPSEYINLDSIDVVNYMLSNDYIDEDSGDAIPDSVYDNWLSQCTDGDSIQANNCRFSDTDPKFGYFSIYTIDHRIQKTMDGEDSVLENSSVTETETDSAPTQTQETDDSTNQESSYLMNSIIALNNTALSTHTPATLAVITPTYGSWNQYGRSYITSIGAVI